jgi:hypothetical protein
MNTSIKILMSLFIALSCFINAVNAHASETLHCRVQAPWDDLPILMNVDSESLIGSEIPGSLNFTAENECLNLSVFTHGMLNVSLMKASPCKRTAAGKMTVYYQISGVSLAKAASKETMQQILNGGLLLYFSSLQDPKESFSITCF